jgi:hypothetical protein
VRVAGVETHPLGPLSGDWAFVISEPRGQCAAGHGELWAIRLPGGESRIAVRYQANVCVGPGNSSPVTPRSNDIRRQLSPDGRRIVLQVASPRQGGQRLGLVIVDLETGDTTSVGRDEGDHDTQPAWSPDGRRLAYVRVPDRSLPFDDGVWLMGVDGRDPRRIIAGGQGMFTFLFDWTPDGRIGFAKIWEQGTYAVFDTVTGQSSPFGGYLIGRYPAQSWRARSPSFTSVFADHPRPTAAYLMVADRPGGPERKLVEENVGDNLLATARWHPTSDEVLCAFGSALYVIDTTSGSLSRISLSGQAVGAEWTPTGSHVVYLHRGDVGSLLGTAVRLIGRDGSAERDLFAANAVSHHITAIATFRYR